MNIFEMKNRIKKKKEKEDVNKFIVDEGEYEVEIESCKVEKIKEEWNFGGEPCLNLTLKIRNEVEKNNFKGRKLFHNVIIYSGDIEELNESDFKTIEKNFRQLENLIKFSSCELNEEEFDLEGFAKYLVGKKVGIKVAKYEKKNQNENGVIQYQNSVLWFFESKVGEISKVDEQVEEIKKNEEVEEVLNNWKQNKENEKVDNQVEEISKVDEQIEEIEKIDEVEEELDYTKYI